MSPFFITAIVIAGAVALYVTVAASISAVRDNREAHGERCRAEILNRQIPEWDSEPILFYISTMHDENYVGVFGRYANGHENMQSQDIVIKKFPYQAGDEEDEDFAFREAQELREKLLEK